MPSISPIVSISSDSAVSSCSDMSGEANFSCRKYVENSSTTSSQEDCSFSPKEHLNNLHLPIKQNGFHDTMNEGVSNADSLEPRENIETTETAEVQEEIVENVERVTSSSDMDLVAPLLNDEVDADFWLPPEPEDQEDDVIGSIANYEDEDDDECGDAVTWARPSSLGSFGEVGRGSFRFKEEKLKAMEDVKNGKFMALVSRLIKSVGFDSSGNNGENWVNIVTSLSWDAAAFVKPDTQEGKRMDPDGYVKVKCIATGSRTESQLVKGLVFKKHAAHKHMPTKFNNPRLLLIHGALDLASGGLSSFELMQQENDNLKPIDEMMEKYHPNVVLVEKSVSRDILESILAKGISLVFDMKLHRLERVARCIGSPILSSEVAIGQKLRKCDAFHIKKFVEEHAVSTEGGKKPTKTLMFLEGAPSRLGCTILLMGANSNELKKIKCVVRCAVVMAYHLMLETSFLQDQSAMFSTISPSEVVDLELTNDQPTFVDTDEVTIFVQNESGAETNSTSTLDTPISNGCHGLESHNLISSSEDISSLSLPALSVSTSLRNTSMASALRLNEGHQDALIGNGVHISGALDTADRCDDPPKLRSEEENLQNNEQPYPPESSDIRSPSDSAEEERQGKDEISSVLETQSILFLMSSRNVSRGTICKEKHFSHIKFYRNFDVPLGRFLRDNLLNQRLKCKTCAEPHEGHFYYYVHHNKQLTIQVRRLPSVKSLPGENEGKLWMWSRCGRCKLHEGRSKSTKRVLISTTAAGLSFGKFLELCFSDHSSIKCPSSCGHSFHKDFLNFFGFGPLVAMFKSSPVSTYSVSLPVQKMEFNSSLREGFLQKDFDEVYPKGISMFLEIEKCLKDLETRYFGITLDIQGSSKEFSDIVEILKEERSQFEVDIQNANKKGSKDFAVCNLLKLNRIRFDLLLKSCLWDQRLHALRSSDLKVIDTGSVDLQSQAQEQELVEEDGLAEEESSATDVAVENCECAIEITSESEINPDVSMDSNEFPNKEILVDGEAQGYANDVAPTISELNGNGSSVDDSLVKSDSGDHPDAAEGNFRQDNFDLSVGLETEKTISSATDTGSSGSDLNHSPKGTAQCSVLSDVLENDKGSIWAQFTNIQCKYMEDLWKGNSPKIESCNSYAAESMAQKLINDEGSRLHFPLDTDDYIVSDYEDEFSSIIACALTLLKDVRNGNEELVEDSQKEIGFDAKNGSSQNLRRVFSFSAPERSAFGSFDSNSFHSLHSTSLGDLHSSGFDGLDLSDSLVSYGASQHRVSMGSRKYPGKRKYSVVCVYGSQFRQLRDRCCPSEVGYIASLSRCEAWDAKGGKSKSFFAKTLDDRFIIKGIQKTEFDSFMKFAPNYFEYMNQCYESGNQTCLAKILGIYQVVIRPTKSGKETRLDLLVMENLSFGRHIARTYDLKGAMHARLSADVDGSGSGGVLLDQNFVNDMNVSPLYVGRKMKRNLQRAVYNDTNFLDSINVMDYSLLVGVDTQRHELVCGIIDYLRQYTWDKQLENWVKSSLVVPKNQSPTILSPVDYKKRFRNFIDSHFLSVPDNWCSQRSLNPCKLCGPSEENVQ